MNNKLTVTCFQEFLTIKVNPVQKIKYFQIFMSKDVEVEATEETNQQNKSNTNQTKQS